MSTEKIIERLKEIEHLAWHLVDNAEDRVMQDEIVIDRQDFESLCKLLPEDHPTK